MILGTFGKEIRANSENFNKKTHFCINEIIDYERNHGYIKRLFLR